MSSMRSVSLLLWIMSVAGIVHATEKEDKSAIAGIHGVSRRAQQLLCDVLPNLFNCDDGDDGDPTSTTPPPTTSQAPAPTPKPVPASTGFIDGFVDEVNDFFCDFNPESELCNENDEEGTMSRPPTVSTEKTPAPEPTSTGLIDGVVDQVNDFFCDFNPESDLCNDKDEPTTTRPPTVSPAPTPSPESTSTGFIDSVVDQVSDFFCDINPESVFCEFVATPQPTVSQAPTSVPRFLDNVVDQLIGFICERSPEAIVCTIGDEDDLILFLLKLLLERYCERNPTSEICFDRCDILPIFPGC